MKLTFSTLASPAWNLGQIIDHAAAAGLDGIDFRGIGSQIDITLLPEFTSDLPATLKLLHERRLQMPCLNTSVTLTTVDSSKWNAMLAEATRYAELASKTTTRFLRIFGGLIPTDSTRESAVRLVKVRLGELIGICKANGCKPLLETHDAWVLSPFILQLLEEFDPGETGVLWDLEHPLRAGESPARTTTQLGKRIEHVHIKDTLIEDGRSVPMLLGKGDLPLAECLAALNHLGYSGWMCLETEKRWHSEGPEPEQSLPQFVDYMRGR